MAVWEVTLTMTPPPRATMPGSTAWTNRTGCDHVGLQLGLELGHREVEDGDHAPGTGVDGVVDQQVHTAPGRQDAVDGPVQGGMVEQIGDELQALAPPCPDQGGRLLEAPGERTPPTGVGLVPALTGPTGTPGQGHVPPMVGQRHGGGLADAPGGPGDQGPPVLRSCRHHRFLADAEFSSG